MQRLAVVNKWRQMSITEQLGNLGSDFFRFCYWDEKDEALERTAAAERFLELLDLTITNQRGQARLKELLRLREIFGDLYLKTNYYQVSLDDLKNYFLQFALMARRQFAK